MMTILSGVWPVIAGAVLALVGVVFGLFKNQQAKTAGAVSDAHAARADQAVAALANVTADQKATSEAEQARQASIAKKAIQDAAIAAQPPGTAFLELQKNDQFSR